MRKTKHFIATILALGMVMACSMVSFAAEPSAQNYAEPASVGRSINASGILTVFVNKTCDVVGEGVRLRRDPGENGEVIGLLYEGEGAWVYTTGQYESTDDGAWLWVSNSSIGQSGWIALQYVRVRN